MKIENFFTPEELALIDSGEYRPGRVELDAKLDFCIAAERERFIQICNHQADIATDYLDKNLLWQLRDAVRARGQA